MLFGTRHTCACACQGHGTRACDNTEISWIKFSIFVGKIIEKRSVGKKDENIHKSGGLKR